MDCRVKPGNDGVVACAARSRSRIWLETCNAIDDSLNTGADIHRSLRYINRARHRPGFWRWIGIE